MHDPESCTLPRSPFPRKSQALLFTTLFQHGFSTGFHKVKDDYLSTIPFINNMTILSYKSLYMNESLSDKPVGNLFITESDILIKFWASKLTPFYKRFQQDIIIIIFLKRKRRNNNNNMNGG